MIGAQKYVMQFRPIGMKNGKYKVSICRSGPLRGSSWRSIMEVKIDIGSLQRVGYGINGMK